MNTVRLVSLSLVVFAALALAACGGTSPSSEPEAEPPATEQPAVLGYSADPAAIVLDITSCCGFVPVEVAVDTRPDFRLYGDGTVLVKPEETELGFPTLRTYRLTPEGIEAVLTATEEAGLLAPPRDFGQPPVTDLPTATVTIALDGETFSHSAYALGFGELEGADLGLTPEQRDARGSLDRFADFVATLDRTDPGLLASPSAPYAPEAVKVYAWEYDAQPNEKPAPWPLEPGIGAWAADESFGSRCAVVSGSDLATLLQAFGEQSMPYVWLSGGPAKTWSTGIALQLPGDPGCEA